LERVVFERVGFHARGVVIARFVVLMAVLVVMYLDLYVAVTRSNIAAKFYRIVHAGSIDGDC